MDVEPSTSPKPSVIDTLPKEMWDYILKEHIPNPQDWLNCYNTTQAWRPLMEKQKTGALLPGVLEVLSNFQKFDGTSLRRVYRLSPQDLRNCRLVSKSWRNGVNNYIAHHPCHDQVLYNNLYYQRKGPPDDFQFPSGIRNKINFWDVSKWTEMLTYLKREKPKMNLFSSRYLVLEDNLSGISNAPEVRKDPEAERRLATSCMEVMGQLLEYVGGHIWHATIVLEVCPLLATDNSCFQFAIMIAALKRLPNLKSLTIRVRQVMHSNGPMVYTPPVVPHLKFLRVVRIEGCYSSVDFAHSLLLANQHIIKLAVQEDTANMYRLQRNLLGVRMQRLQEGFLLLSGQGYTHLEALQLIKWPLTRVEIETPFFHIKAPDLFRTLYHSRETLTHLHAGFMEHPKQNTIEVDYDFPKLQDIRLVFHCPAGFYYHDFRTDSMVEVKFKYPLVSLKKLNLSCLNSLV